MPDARRGHGRIARRDHYRPKAVLSRLKSRPSGTPALNRAPRRIGCKNAVGQQAVPLPHDHWSRSCASFRNKKVTVEAEEKVSLPPCLPDIGRPTFCFVTSNAITANYKWNDEIDELIAEGVRVITRVEERNDLLELHAKSGSAEFPCQCAGQVDIGCMLFPSGEDAGRELTVW